MSLDFKLNGGGGMVMNVDNGVLKSSDSKVTFGGKLKMAGESDDIAHDKFSGDDEGNGHGEQLIETYRQWSIQQ